MYHAEWVEQMPQAGIEEALVTKAKFFAHLEILLFLVSIPPHAFGLLTAPCGVSPNFPVCIRGLLLGVL